MPRALCAFLLAGLFFDFGLCVEVKPTVSYEYVTGSQDYYSHNGSGGLLFKFKKNMKLFGVYSLSADSDYRLIQSGMARLKRWVASSMEVSGALVLSNGEFRNSTGDFSSASLDFKGTRYFDNRFEWSGGYRFTQGSFSFSSQREVLVPRGRRLDIVLVEENQSLTYTAHSLSSAVGYEFGSLLKNLFTTFQISVAFNSDSSRSDQEGLEIFYGFPKEFYLGLSYTLTQNTESVHRNYLGLSLSKYF